MYIYQSACVDTVSVESGHRVAALGRVGHILRKTCTKVSTSYLELLFEQKLKLEHQFDHFQPKMGLKPHAVRPQRPFWRGRASGPQTPKRDRTAAAGVPGSKYARGGFQIFPPFLVYTLSDWLAYLELGHVTFIPLSAHQPGVKL